MSHGSQLRGFLLGDLVFGLFLALAATTISLMYYAGVSMRDCYKFLMYYSSYLINMHLPGGYRNCILKCTWGG